MAYVARAAPWLNDTDPGGTLPANSFSKADGNRLEANQADANTRLLALEANAVTSTSIDLIVSLTQAAYDALGVKDSRTLYVIT